MLKRIFLVFCLSVGFVHDTCAAPLVGGLTTEDLKRATLTGAVAVLMSNVYTLIHECGHAAAIKRVGGDVDVIFVGAGAPTDTNRRFFRFGKLVIDPLMIILRGGGVTTLKRPLLVTAHEGAFIALAGPLAGLAASFLIMQATKQEAMNYLSLEDFAAADMKSAIIYTLYMRSFWDFFENLLILIPSSVQGGGLNDGALARKYMPEDKQKLYTPVAATVVGGILYAMRDYYMPVLKNTYELIQRKRWLNLWRR